jgi:hypothetical protein
MNEATSERQRRKARLAASSAATPVGVPAEDTVGAGWAVSVHAGDVAGIDGIRYILASRTSYCPRKDVSTRSG